MRVSMQDPGDSFSLVRETMRWRVAMVLCGLQIVLMVALGFLNTYMGFRDTAILAWTVLTVSTVCMVLLLSMPRAAGANLFFSIIALLLVLVPVYGLYHGRPMQSWSYVLPPLLVFLLPARKALWGMVLYGLYVCAVLRLLVAPIEIVRFASAYGLMVCFIYTYALLEERAVALLRHHYNHDALTNCLNRRTFNAMLDRLSRDNARAETCTILLADIDHFKGINDQYGHLTGDRVLTQVADVLKRHMPTGSSVFRYGGEEFAILLRGQAADQSGAFAETLRCAVSATDYDGVPVTISIGVAHWQRNQSFVNAALDRADRALYTAKRAGRNRVVVAAEQP